MEPIVHVVVGLGNPGPRYAATRHNIGWLVLDELARRRGLSFTGAGSWTAAADPAAGLVLIKPQTYMNLSGEGLLAWAAASGVALTGSPDPAPEAPGAGQSEPPAQVAPPAGLRPLAICDDLALPLGAVRLRERGSSGGQNGLTSLIEHLGGGEFPRLRLGIAPADEPVPAEEWASYVLAPFTQDEREAVAEVVACAADAVEACLAEGVAWAGSRYNRRRPATPPGAD